ncbi:MAG: tail fiber protein [Saprospiraceae bacterium]
MKLIVLIYLVLCICRTASAQYVGIGTPTPGEKLDVNGNVKANALTLNTGGSPYDFLMKNNASGQVGFKKGHGALALHYMIAYDGFFPTSSGPYNYNVTMVAEIKLFSGNFAPSGWLFCEGQILTIGSYIPLFQLIGTTYGGNGTTNFALPDLRGAVPVSAGTSAGGYSWELGEKSN